MRKVLTIVGVVLVLALGLGLVGLMTDGFGTGFAAGGAKAGLRYEALDAEDCTIETTDLYEPVSFADFDQNLWLNNMSNGYYSTSSSYLDAGLPPVDIELYIKVNNAVMASYALTYIDGNEYDSWETADGAVTVYWDYYPVDGLHHGYLYIATEESSFNANGSYFYLKYAAGEYSKKVGLTTHVKINDFAADVAYEIAVKLSGVVDYYTGNGSDEIEMTGEYRLTGNGIYYMILDGGFFSGNNGRALGGPILILANVVDDGYVLQFMHISSSDGVRDFAVTGMTVSRLVA
jgi:hypothetical protein